MELPKITEDEILALLEKYPEGRSLEGLAKLVNKIFPAGIMGRLIKEGKVITVDHAERGERYREEPSP